MVVGDPHEKPLYDSPEDKAKYKKEAEDFDSKSDRFQKEMERVLPKKK